MAKRTSFYPVCLALTNRPCLVVGGGPVARRKVNTLLRYGARVTVVSPTLTPALRRWVQQGRIVYRQRLFRAGDVGGCVLVYGATDDPTAQQRIFRAATRREILVNIVDVPALCSFIAPAQVKRGDLVIAITTGGRAPGVAKAVRQRIERLITPEYARAVRVLGRTRQQLRSRIPSPGQRQRIIRLLMRRLLPAETTA